jgi:hypothetical protein
VATLSAIFLNIFMLFLIILFSFFNNNNNQAFYFQANWDRLEMKPHEKKKEYKTRVKKKGKTKGDKKTK